MKEFVVYQWDEVRFGDSQKEWSELLERSSSDKLFMSWEWLFTWWDTFSDLDNLSLRLFAAYDDEGKLVGLAPLYLQQVTTKKFFKTNRLQFLGNFWRSHVTMRTELQDFIADNQCSNEVVTAFYKHINSLSGWDELVLSDLNKKSKSYEVLLKDLPLANSYYRNAEENDSYYLTLNDTFDVFSKSLGKNTRLKLLNRRKILEGMGDVELVSNMNLDYKECFDLLNSLHIKRWGRPVFEGKRLDFNRKVAELMSEKGALHFSVLTLDNKAISIQYNYIVDKHEYNIQAGFDEDFHKKISLGYLHFGYEIEFAFENKLKIYDFLAGEGKNTQYKERLTKSIDTIACMQIIRNRYLKILYCLYDFYRKQRGS